MVFIEGILTAWPIRKKLQLLLLLVFLPSCGIIIWSGLDHRGEAIARAQSNALLVVQSLAAQQEQIAAGTEQMLSILAQLPEVQSLDAEGCDKLFHELLRRRPFYSAIMAATPDGTMFAGSAQFLRGSINVSDRKYAKDAIRTLSFSVGEFIVGRLSKVQSIDFSYPVLDSNKNLLGIVIAGFKLDEYFRFITKANLPESSSFAITDHAGVRLFRYPADDATAPGIPIPRDALERASGEPDQGTFEKVGEDGVLRVYAFRSLRLREEESPYLYLFVGIPKAAIVHKANLEMLRNLSILGIAAFFAVCLAWLFGSLAFIRPINHLLEATRRFGKGEIQTRTGLQHTQDEMGQLAASFDDMASLLETRSMERWNAEEALRESEERYRNISSSISDFAFSCTKPSGGSHAIDWLAGAVEGITGYSIRDIMDNGCWRFLVHPEDTPVFDKNVTGLEPGSSGQCELRIIHKDGSIRWVRAASRVAESSGFLDPHCLFGSCEDITERKLAEDKLKESQRRLLQIIEFLPDAILVLDKEGKVLAWNLAMEVMTGVKAEEMIGKGNYEYSLPFYGIRRPILIDLALHPNHEMEKYYTVIHRRENIVFGEAFVPCLAPGNVHLSATASVLRDSKGEVIAAIECIRDNTERRKLEERLQRAEKMEALGTMAGGVAHDLNNVLGIIVGYSEMLLYDLDASSPHRPHATEILKGGQRAAAIVQDLLTLARRGVPSREVLNLNTVIKDVQGSPEFAALCTYHPELRIKTDLEPDLLNLSGSAIHLGKSLMNLVANAAEATRGGGALTVKTANCYLDKPISGYDEVRQGDYVVLSVSDTGEGIQASDLKRIFEPFYTKKVMGRSGTGLGLAVVWGTIKDHLGYINVESDEGKGTIFTLYFPVTRE